MRGLFLKKMKIYTSCFGKVRKLPDGKKDHKRKMNGHSEKLRQFCVMLEKAYKATANSTLRFA